MRKLIECVPNFSEGRDNAVIDDITAQIETVEGVKLLDVDPGRPLVGHRLQGGIGPVPRREAVLGGGHPGGGQSGPEYSAPRFMASNRGSIVSNVSSGWGISQNRPALMWSIASRPTASGSIPESRAAATPPHVATRLPPRNAIVLSHRRPSQKGARGEYCGRNPVQDASTWHRSIGSPAVRRLSA